MIVILDNEYTNEKYMRMAIYEAAKGVGWVNPNPLVGAVIVKDGEVISKGYHARYGDLHAERSAIKNATKDISGADMYVTLEPCNHTGNQPPCTHAIVEAGIKRVYIGSRDPNPIVSGSGIEYLKEHGVEVITDYMREECDELNPIFFHYITKKRPYVVYKYAMTMDGKIATRTGDSKWITGEKARHRVHEERHKYSAIMVGMGTVLSDDPLLTCRIPGGNNPTRVICDTNLRIPMHSQIVATAFMVPTIIAHCIDVDAAENGNTETGIASQSASYMDDLNRKIKELEEKGCKVIQVKMKNGFTDLDDLLGKLGEMGLDSVYVEGGGTFGWSVLTQGIVNKVHAYVSPKIIGGAGAKTPVEGFGVDKIADCIKLKNPKIIQIGEDFVIESEVV